MGKAQYPSYESYNTQDTSFGTFQEISSPRIRLESFDTYPYGDSSSRRVVSDSFLQRSLSSSGTYDTDYTDSYHSSRSIPSSLETQISHETGLNNRICTLPDYFSHILGPTADETILVGLKLLVNQGFLLPECDAIANNGSSDFSTQTDYTYSTNESTQTYDTEIGHSFETGAIEYNSSNTYDIQLPKVNSPSIGSEDSMETYYEEGSIKSVESVPQQFSSEPISEKSPSNESIIPTETISELPVIEEIQKPEESFPTVETIREPSVMSIESVDISEPEPINEEINSPEPSVSILTEIPGEEEKITVEYEEPDPPSPVLNQSFIEVPTSEVVVAWNMSVISDDVRSQVLSEKSNALLSKTSSNQNNHEVKLSVINTEDDQPNVDDNERSKIAVKNMSENSTLNYPTPTEKESRRSRKSSNDLKPVSSRKSRRNSNNSEEPKRDADDSKFSRRSRRDSEDSNSSKRSRRDSNDSDSSYRKSRGGSKNEHRGGSKDEHRKSKSSKDVTTEPVDLERAKKAQHADSRLKSSSKIPTKHSHVTTKESKEPRRSSIEKKRSRKELRAKDSIAVEKYHERVKEKRKQQGMIEEISETESTISSSSPSRSSFRSSVDSDDDIDEKPLKMDKSCSTASILKSKTSSTDTYSLSCQVISSCDAKNKKCVCRCSCCKCIEKKKPPPRKPCPCVKNRSYLCSSEPQKVNEENNYPCQNSTIEEKLYCDCYTTTSSTDSLGFLQNGDCGHSKGAIRYAITKITEYEKFTTFEVMKSTRKVPKFMPRSLEGVFVLKHK